MERIEENNVKLKPKVVNAECHKTETRGRSMWLKEIEDEWKCECLNYAKN